MTCAARWRRGSVHRFYHRLVDRMIQKGYDPEFSERIFSQIEGFGEYGFPESHAASFAKLVYVSCWLKCHEPACFLAAMINSQPMGFYSPSQLVQDARKHGIEVRPLDVTVSAWDCTLEESSALQPEGISVHPDPSTSSGQGTLRVSKGASIPQPERGMTSQYPGIRPNQPAVRLGLRLVSGFSEAAAQRITEARSQSPFKNAEDLALRAQLGTLEMNALAAADALLTLAGHRRQQVWEAAAIKPAPQLLKAVPTHETALMLPDTPEGENILFDYQATGLTLRRHRGLLSAGELNELPDGRKVAACGIVTVRQQPQTAKGTIFVTLEDETGPVNVIVWKSLRDTQREEVMHARLLAVHGTWQRSEEDGKAKGYGAVRNLVAHRLEDLTPMLGRLGTSSRDFH
jgi:error-prone DNA polymerase